MKTALLLVDLQNDYFPGGKMELFKPVEASLNARQLLDFFRQADQPVVFIQHVAEKPGAAFFLPGTSGAEIHSSIRPQEGEPVILKHHPNSFLKTPLLETLQAQEIHRLVICGMQTNMCIDATTRAASDLGFDCLVAADACAARDLAFGGQQVRAADVHTAFLAALHGTYARVMNTDGLLAVLKAELQPG